MTPPTDSAIFQHAFLGLWTLKHTGEVRGAHIGWPLVHVGHRVGLIRCRSLCEKERSILSDGGREDAGGGCGINVKITDGWH